MKPVKLKFKGINSFSEQTEIDFEKLIKNGIFGIFGDTGSGKSTILDCINFALYGKVERSREKLDIINYRSEAAEVSFEFNVLNEGKHKRYTVERSIKRKSGLHKAALYEDDNCIADNASTVTKKITDILGVDAEDFRKCIALPQGEFSQFVKSQPSERIALIERLFSLSKYGDRLKERIKVRESQAEMSYQTITAKLGLYSDISSEVIKNLEEQIESYKERTSKLIAENEEAEKEYLKLKSLGEKRAELDETVIRLSELEKLKPQMEELRAGLKSAPICKAVVETNTEAEEKTNKISAFEKCLSELDREIEVEKKKTADLNRALLEGNYDEAIANCIALSAKYSACEGKPEKLVTLENSLESKRKEYRIKDNELSKLKEKLVKAQSEVEATEKMLNAGASKNLEEIINVNFKGAILKDEYVNSLDYFVGLNGQVKFHKDDSDLFKFIERELRQQIEIYRDRVYQVKDFSLEEAKKQLRSIQTAGEEREKLTALLNDKKADVKEIENAINDCEKDIRIILRDGEELRKQSDEIKNELKKVFGDIKDFAYAEKVNTENLERLKKRKAQLVSDIEGANKKLFEMSSEQSALQAERKTALAELERLKEKLKSLLLQSGFDSVVSCSNIAEKFLGHENAEKELSEYDSKLISVSDRIAELKNTEGLKDFSAEQLTAALNRKDYILNEISSAREKLAVLESDFKKAETRLAEKKSLQKELIFAEKERNLIFQLKDLTKGNKFMEFIANEYLYDISALASSTLLNLTDGRYFLTYTDTFYAGDNFNCGNLRGVNTLSGGETFLVSLSLALALSQTICASLKSIEFFFLDEGFGTLDGTLVDTVMNALEKLKSSRFTIGVISHVEELKHRIDNKITVNKATESHGSTVQISC